MSVSQYASDAKIAQAVAALGTSAIAQTEQALLQQLVVAAATASGGGGGGAAAWGSITGTLSAQTDLQTALNAKLNLAGGTMTGDLTTKAAGLLIPGAVSGTVTVQAPAVAGTPIVTLPSVTSTLATLGANGFTGVQIVSVNGAASTPAVSLTGTIFTGGTATTTKPQFLIEPTGATSTNWNTAGTLLGCNAPSGFTGSVLDTQINGTSLWRFQPVGASESYPTILYGAQSSGLAMKFCNNTQMVLRRTDANDFISFVYTDVCCSSATKLGFNGTNAVMGGGNGLCDAFFARSAAAHIKMGALHATTPTNQTFSAHNVTTGTGAALTLAGGTGTTTPGSQLILSGGVGGTGASTITAKVSSGGATTTIFTVAEDGITIGDNLFINAGTTSGLTIASSTSQKLGFWAASPVVQGAAITDVPSEPSVTGSDTVSQANLESVLASYGTAINDILTRLRNPGFIAT